MFARKLESEKNVLTRMWLQWKDTDATKPPFNILNTKN